MKLEWVQWTNGGWGLFGEGQGNSWGLSGEGQGNSLAEVIIGEWYASGNLYGKIGAGYAYWLSTNDVEEAKAAVLATYLLTEGS